MVSHSALKSSKLYSDSRISDSNKAVGPSYALTVIAIIINPINIKEIFIYFYYKTIKVNIIIVINI